MKDDKARQSVTKRQNSLQPRFFPPFAKCKPRPEHPGIAMLVGQFAPHVPCPIDVKAPAQDRVWGQDLSGRRPVHLASSVVERGNRKGSEMEGTQAAEELW